MAARITHAQWVDLITARGGIQHLRVEEQVSLLEDLAFENEFVVGSTALSEAEVGVLDGVTPGLGAASKAVVLDSSRRVSGVLTPSTARTATADGLTTGIIADDGGFDEFIAVTSASADNIIVLPTPVVGKKITLNVGANGFELRSNSPTTVGINGGTGADAESAIAANSTILAICVSATSWKAFFLDADSDVAKVEAAA